MTHSTKDNLVSVQEQRVVVVTGGTGGLGVALCDLLNESGWFVYSISRAPATGSEHATRKHIQYDLSSDDPIDNPCSSITHPRIDLLINNAGIAYNENSEDSELCKDYEKIFRVNFLSAVRLKNKLKEKLSGGTVVNISSDLSYFPVEYLSLYSASKSALNSWSGSCAQSCKETRFITIIPSMIDTPLLRKLLGERYAECRNITLSPDNLAEKILAITDDETVETGSEVFIENEKIAHEPQDLLKKKIFIKLQNTDSYEKGN